MSGIVIGGLLGAAAAMYFSRGNRSFSFSGLGNAGQALDNVVEKARSKMMAPDKRSYYGDTSSGASASNASAGANAQTAGMGGSTAGSGMGRVESIVKQDPMLKSQVNEILSENQGTSTLS